MREFRYHPNPRGRFMVRDLDHNDQEWQWSTIGAEHWTDYDRAMPYGDFDVTLDPNNAPVETEQMRHLEGFGLPAQQTVSTSATQYLHGDLIRSTMLTTGQGGTAVSAVSYTAFGEVIGTGPGTRYQYAGGWGYETGGFGDDPGLLVLNGAPGTAPITLQHVGFRWYEPAIGRFMQRDPLGIFGGLNVYTYGHNMPTITVDPDGQAFWVVVVVVVVVGAAIITAVKGCGTVSRGAALARNPTPRYPEDYDEIMNDRRIAAQPCYDGRFAECIPVVVDAAQFTGTTASGGPAGLPTDKPSSIKQVLDWLWEKMKDVVY